MRIRFQRGTPNSQFREEAVTHTPFPGVVSTMPELTDDDVSKHVVTADGDEVGLVTEVEDGTAYVDPDRDVPSQLKSKLNWSATHKDTHPLRNDAIDEVTDDEIKLRPEYAAN